MPYKKSRIQLYADECFPVTSATHLRSLGYSLLHAFDKKLVQRLDSLHLRTAKKLNRVLITLDRDFLYYGNADLDDHPGVIVISSGSATTKNINLICEKMLKKISREFVKESLLKVTIDKILKFKDGKLVGEKVLS